MLKINHTKIDGLLICIDLLVIARKLFTLSVCLFSQGPVGFKVLIPNMPDRPEWNLNGRMVTITLPITDPVSLFVCLFFSDYVDHHRDAGYCFLLLLFFYAINNKHDVHVRI